jgi:hypothetical protein
MNKSNIYKQLEECLLEDMDGELLLYNPINSTTLHLNGPSAIVWNLCDGEATVQQMIDAVREAYPDQSEQIETDIINVVKDFIEREFLVLVDL